MQRKLANDSHCLHQQLLWQMQLLVQGARTQKEQVKRLQRCMGTRMRQIRDLMQASSSSRSRRICQMPQALLRRVYHPWKLTPTAHQSRLKIRFCLKHMLKQMFTIKRMPCKKSSVDSWSCHAKYLPNLPH